MGSHKEHYLRNVSIKNTNDRHNKFALKSYMNFLQLTHGSRIKMFFNIGFNIKKKMN